MLEDYTKYTTTADKLLFIQKHLKAPKSQYNSFGKYNYRNCEDILNAAKPLLADMNAALVLSDDVVMIGDRYYVKATAVLRDGETLISVTAYAREQDNKKGMDEAQITGAASSYARKYALNGLFCIDDTKDADSDAPEAQKPAKKPPEKSPEPTEVFTWDALVKMHDLPPTATEEFVKHIVKTTQEGSKAGIDGVKNKARKNPKSFVEKCRKWIEEETKKEASDQEVGDNTPPKLDEVNANE